MWVQDYLGNGKMTKQLRTFVAFSEDTSLSPSTYASDSQLPAIPGLGESYAFFWPLCAPTYSYIHKNIFFKKSVFRVIPVARQCLPNGHLVFPGGWQPGNMARFVEGLSGRHKALGFHCEHHKTCIEVLHTCYASTREAESGKSDIDVQSQLHRKFGALMCYRKLK